MATTKHPLKEHRESRSPRMSQDDLARLLGVQRNTVSRWEGGRRIDLAYIQTITKKTGIPANKLRPDLAKIIGEAAE